MSEYVFRPRITLLQHTDQSPWTNRLLKGQFQMYTHQPSAQLKTSYDTYTNTHLTQSRISILAHRYYYARQYKTQRSALQQNTLYTNKTTTVLLIHHARLFHS